MQRQAESRRPSRIYVLYLLTGLAAFMLVMGVGGWWAYEYDPRVRFRVQEMWSQVKYVVVTPPSVVPTAVSAGAPPTFAAPVASTLTATPSAQPATDIAPATPTTAASPTVPPPTPTALPGRVVLEGFRHEYQLYNNCGPASLSIDLSYWGWDGNQKIAAKVLKPNQDDKNVSPRELYEYALTQGYDAYIRVNGDVDTLRRFVAAGYPVLVEKGFDCDNNERCSDWFGHYSTVTGYDDAKQLFVLQDSYRGPNITISYDDMLANWRAFNYLYVVFFPAGPEHDAGVLSLLGPAADVDQNYRDALARAQEETTTTTGRDLAFAWFSVGTNLHNLQDYAGAAAAYDQARQAGLPYRMLWYQFGPYRSYYYMGRYQDVAELATFAIDSVNTVAGLEEAYYWRGQAEVALGQPDKAVEDYRTALARHPGYQPAIEGLAALGAPP